MPWKATDAMKERVNLVLEWERRWNESEGHSVDTAEPCRKYGVSRPTGSAWVKRFREANLDVRAVEEKSRRPHSNPQVIPPEVGDNRAQRHLVHRLQGQFRMQDGDWCQVLTLLDAEARYLLRAEPMLDPTGDNVEKVLDSAFQEFGLPKAMRSDKGPPLPRQELADCLGFPFGGSSACLARGLRGRSTRLPPMAQAQALCHQRPRR